MKLSPEGIGAVVRQLNTEALAENVEEQLGWRGVAMSEASYGELRSDVEDAVADALSAIDFKQEGSE